MELGVVAVCRCAAASPLCCVLLMQPVAVHAVVAAPAGRVRSAVAVARRLVPVVAVVVGCSCGHQVPLILGCDEANCI